MGTYTTNYNLFMPTVGETGWGTLVNGNFTTIDTTMSGLNTRLTAVENEVNGALSCTSVTTSGKVTANGGIGTTSLTTSSTITSTGLITANGGIKGNLTGNVTGKLAGTRTLVTSAPYNVDNVVVFTVPSFSNPSHTSSKSATVSVPATLTTPYGSFSLTRPTFTVTYTVKFTAGTGSNVITVKFNGTNIWSKSMSKDNSPQTFTITLDTSISNSFVVSASTNYGVTLTPNITSVYLK